MNLVSDFIKVYDDVISEELCRDIIYLYKVNSHFHSKVNNNKRPKFTELNFTANLDKMGNIAGSIHSQILQNLRQLRSVYFSEVISKAFDGVSFIPGKYGWEQLRIKKYSDPSDQFREHVDIGDSVSSKRFVAFLLYLNDGFDGGETEFTTCGLTIKPKSGRVVMFPPTWNFPHQGNKLASGEKYILSTYLNYL